MESRPGSRWRLSVAVLAVCGLVPSVHAVNFGDMMNPGKWFGGSRDEGPYGYGAPGYPPPGYGYGAPAYGYGAPGVYAPYGYAQPPAAVTPAVPAAPAAPAVQAAPKADDSEERIKALEQRIRELEAAQRAPQPAPSSGYSSSYSGGTPLPMQSLPPAQQGGGMQQQPTQPMIPGGGNPTFRPMGLE